MHSGQITKKYDSHGRSFLRKSSVCMVRMTNSVANLGFSPGGAPTPKVGVLTNFLGRKLHENERIWTPGGGASLAPPLDPPLLELMHSISNWLQKHELE